MARRCNKWRHLAGMALLVAWTAAGGAAVRGGDSSGIRRQVYPRPFPRDHATKRLENDRVIVWDVQWPKGQATPMHQHRYPSLNVVLGRGRHRVMRPGGEVVFSPMLEAGTFAYSERGLVHAELGLSDPPLRGIVIEFKDRQAPRRDRPAGIEPAFGSPEFTRLLRKDRVTLWDLRYLPGRRLPLHYHERDVVVIVYGKGEVQTRSAGGETEVSHWTFGDVYWTEGGYAHSAEAVAGSPAAYVLELR